MPICPFTDLKKRTGQFECELTLRAIKAGAILA